MENRAGQRVMSDIYAGGSYRSYVSTNLIKKYVLCYVELKFISQVFSDAHLCAERAEHVSSCEQGYISAKAAY